MNNLQRLIAAVGGVTTLADICGVARQTIYENWMPDGKLPVKYNHRVKAFVAAQVDRSDVWRGHVVDCLEPDVCPTCGQPLEGRVI